MVTREELEGIRLRQNAEAIEKWKETLIRSHDIRMFLTTIDNEGSRLQAASDDIDVMVSQASTYFNKLPQLVRNHLAALQVVLEINRDLRASLHCILFAYDKTTNMLLRNVLESVFRLIYFKHYPGDVALFATGQNWLSLNRTTIAKLKVHEPLLADNIKALHNKLSEYTHSHLSKRSQNMLGFNVYRKELVNEWYDNFVELGKIVSAL